MANKISVLIEVQEKLTSELGRLVSTIKGLDKRLGLQKLNEQGKRAGTSLKGVASQAKKTAPVISLVSKESRLAALSIRKLTEATILASRAMRTVAVSSRGAGAGISSVGVSAASSTGAVVGMTTASKGLTVALSRLATFLLPLVTIVLFLKTVRTIGEFQQRMAGVQSVTSATKSEMEAMTATARRLGAETKFSASEAAAGMEFLGRAGFEANQIVEAMPGVLNLAAAGQLGLAEAADIASNILTGFGAEASRASEVADLLALTAASSNTNVAQLGQAMSFVAPVAAELGISMAETATAIGKLSDAGVQGTRAGTGLRRVFSSLANITPKAQKALSKYNIDLSKLNPATNSLSTITKELAKAELETGDAFKIFGDRGAIAALVLARSASAGAKAGKSFDDLAGKLDNAGGTAARMAKILSDTIPGAAKTLSSAFDELILQVGDGGFSGVIRNVIDGITILIRGFTGMNKEGKGLGGRLDKIGQSFRIMFSIVSDIFGTFTDIFATSQELQGSVNGIQGLFLGISLILAIMQDGTSLLAATFAQIGVLIFKTIALPLKGLILIVAEIVGIFDEDLARSIRSFQDELTVMGDRGQEAVDRIGRSFENGETATQRMINKLKDLDAEQVKRADRAKVVADAEVAAAKQVQVEIDAIIKKLGLTGLVDLDEVAKLELLKDKAQRVIEELEFSFEKGRISANKFFTERVEIQSKVINAEIALLREQLRTTVESEKQARIATQILILQRERRDLSVQASREQVTAEEELSSALSNVRDELTKLSGADVNLTDLKSKLLFEFRDTIAQLESEGDTAGVILIEKLVDTKVSQVRFNELERQANTAFKAIATTQAQVNIQAVRGTISEAEAQRVLNFEYERQKLVIEATLPALQAQAEAINNPELALKIQALRDKFASLNPVVTRLAAIIDSTLQTSISQLFTDLVSGTSTVKGAFAALGGSILATFQRILANKLTTKLLSLLAGGGSGSVGGAIAGFFTAAEGGQVSGPGTTTSDSIPSLLSRGEYVVKAKAVRHYGAGVLEAINRMRLPLSGATLPRITIPRIPHFASGGLVTDSAGSGGSNSVTIANFIDPQLFDSFIKRKGGQRAVINVIRQNPSSISKVLKK